MRLFITHGGLGSVMEILRAGVPVVAIPHFGDQYYNVRICEHLGVGVKLDRKELSAESITSAMQTVLNDTR